MLISNRQRFTIQNILFKTTILCWRWLYAPSCSWRSQGIYLTIFIRHVYLISFSGWWRSWHHALSIHNNKGHFRSVQLFSAMSCVIKLLPGDSMVHLSIHHLNGGKMEMSPITCDWSSCTPAILKAPTSKLDYRLVMSHIMWGQDVSAKRAINLIQREMSAIHPHILPSFICIVELLIIIDKLDTDDLHWHCIVMQIVQVA